MTGKQLKLLYQETVNRNRINLAAREKVLNSRQMLLNYSDIVFINLFVSSFIYLLAYFYLNS